MSWCTSASTRCSDGAGFSAHVAQGDEVEIGQPILRYDVAAVEAAGRNPVVPVIVLDRKADTVALRELAAGADVTSLRAASHGRAEVDLEDDLEHWGVGDVEVVILDEPARLAHVAADAITALLGRTPDATLGLATGSSPLAVYDETSPTGARGGRSASRQPVVSPSTSTSGCRPTTRSAIGR